MAQRYLKHLALLLILFFTALTAFSAPQKRDKVVRVGWFSSVFNQIDESGERYGFAYDFQRSIAAHTGWTYQYVEGSWPDLYDMLRKGEIDLLSDVAYTPQRSYEVLFSDREMGRDEYYIVYPKDSKKIDRENPKSLEGLRIGVNKNTYLAQVLHRWLKSHGIKAKVLEQSNTTGQWVEKLDSGEIDAMACIFSFHYMYQDRYVALASIGSGNVFFAVNKHRMDLKEQLDEAMTKIYSYNVNYINDLNTFYSMSSTSIAQLSAEETKWARKHGTIRIGYRNDYMPFCNLDAETGKLQGALADLITLVNARLKEYGVHVEGVPFPSFAAAADALKQGKIDMAFPNGYTQAIAEEDGMVISDAFVKSVEFAIVRNGYILDFDKRPCVAVNAVNKGMEATIAEQYPSCDVAFFPDVDACLEGISKGKADFITAGGYRMSLLYPKLDRLNLKPVPQGNTLEYCFVVPESVPELYAILNRMMIAMSDEEKNASLIRWSTADQETTFIGFFRDHLWEVIAFFVIVIMLYSILLFTTFVAHRKAKVASKAKTRFLFNMSHDIRTPMNAIIGYSSLMEQNMDDREKVRNYLDKIRTSSHYLLELINNVLEMSRIESGKNELNEQPCLIGEIIHDGISVYADLMKQKGITFIYNENINVKAIYCDRMKLNELLMNLLSNAYKYTMSGGTVSVNIEEKESTQPDKVVLQCKVADTGIGMSADYLPHIFEDFTREQTYTENKIHGTGLGMSIVKRFVDLMHGTVSVESELGKGTIFTLTLPFRIADASQIVNGEDETVDMPSFEGRHILLVEDNELNAEIATEVLSDEGFKVTWAKDGKECVEMFDAAEAGTFDLILMDVQMPVMGGYEATRRIRKMNDPKKAGIPIVAMTANAFAEDRAHAIGAGMNDHVAKPIDVPVLLKTIAGLMK